MWVAGMREGGGCPVLSVTLCAKQSEMGALLPGFLPSRQPQNLSGELPSPPGACNRDKFSAPSLPIAPSA